MKKRLIYFGISILCFLLCVLIVVSFSHKPVVRGFLGDSIVIVLIFYFIKGIHDFNSFKLMLFTLLLSFIVEFMQFLHIAEVLGLENNMLFRLVFGSVFDVMDLVAYTIGACLSLIIDAATGKILDKNI